MALFGKGGIGNGKIYRSPAGLALDTLHTMFFFFLWTCVFGEQKNIFLHLDARSELASGILFIYNVWEKNRLFSNSGHDVLLEKNKTKKKNVGWLDYSPNWNGLEDQQILQTCTQWRLLPFYVQLSIVILCMYRWLPVCPEYSQCPKWKSWFIMSLRFWSSRFLWKVCSRLCQRSKVTKASTHVHPSLI